MRTTNLHSPRPPARAGVGPARFLRRGRRTAAIGAGATLAFVLIVPALAAGSLQGNKLERFPEEALLATGRVVEVGGAPAARIIVRGNTAGLRDDDKLRFDLLNSTLKIDLSEADGEVFFVGRDRVVPLTEAWALLRPGQVVEIAVHPQHTATVRRVRGTRHDEQPGRGQGMPGQPSPRDTFRRSLHQAIEVDGWIYVWVLADRQPSGGEAAAPRPAPRGAPLGESPPRLPRPR